MRKKNVHFDIQLLVTRCDNNYYCVYHRLLLSAQHTEKKRGKIIAITSILFYHFSNELMPCNNTKKKAQNMSFV